MQHFISSLRRDISLLAASGLVVIGTFLDTMTTQILVNTPGLVEANPVIEVVVGNFGMLGVVVFKLFTILSLLGLIVTLYPPQHYRHGVLYVFWTSGLVWVVAGIWNVRLLWG